MSKHKQLYREKPITQFQYLTVYGLSCIYIQPLSLPPHPDYFEANPTLILQLFQSLSKDSFPSPLSLPTGCSWLKMFSHVIFKVLTI